VKPFEFVKENTRAKKDVPVIISCNRVDSPHDERSAKLVREISGKVQEIFKVTDREDALVHLPQK
jgi:hypothetical protein